MSPSEDQPGEHSVIVPGAGEGADYTFILDGRRALPDPVSRWQPQGVHGPSRVVDPRRFAWTDSAWPGLTLEELVLYELHVGTFTDEGSFPAIVPRLADLAALGVTAIELMPVAQFPGERNWGYDGVGLYAVQNSYGRPDDLRMLVDAAHAAGLGVVLDVVYNHVGPEGNYLDAFGPYFTEKYRTPWGRALNYDDADSDEVRRYVIDNARYWISEYHIDGLRLDAVHGIFDFSARHLVEELTAAVHEQGERRGVPALVIGESDLNDPRLIRRPEEHGFGLDAQWSDDFHHAVHAALTGETSGYYADYGGAESIAAALREPFVYDGRYSAHRRRRHGASSRGIPRRRFVVAVQNHDQVGNRAAGERLATLVSPERLRLAAALLVLSPYIPLIFMGEEYGETNPFLYFVSHGDPELVSAVREGRRSEFASFGWGDDVPDPADPATYSRSRIAWEKAGCGDHGRLRRLFADLLALRREERALRPDGAAAEVVLSGRGTIVLTRGEILTIFNCFDGLATVSLGSHRGTASLRLATDASVYGGLGESIVIDGGSAVRVAPWTAVVLTLLPAPDAG